MDLDSSYQYWGKAKPATQEQDVSYYLFPTSVGMNRVSR